VEKGALKYGFDSFFEDIRNKILNKDIPQSEILRISSIKLPDVFFYSYIIFGTYEISKESVMKSVEQFNSIFTGVTAIEFREHENLRYESQPSSQKLKAWLQSNCFLVDFIMEDDEQWKIVPDKTF